MRERPRPEDRLGRAAGLGAVCLGVGPELQRHRDDLRPALPLQQCRDGAVDPTGHRDQDAVAGRRRKHLARAGGGGQRPVQRIGGELRRVPLGGRQPPDCRVDLVDPDPRRVEHRPLAGQVHGGRGSRPCRPAPLRVEGRVDDPPSVDRERDPRKIAAGGPTGSPAESTVGGSAQARLIPKVGLEQLPAHARAHRSRVERKRGPSPPLPPLALIPSMKVGAYSLSQGTGRNQLPRRLCWVKR